MLPHASSDISMDFTNGRRTRCSEDSLMDSLDQKSGYTVYVTADGRLIGTVRRSKCPNNLKTSSYRTSNGWLGAAQVHKQV